MREAIETFFEVAKLTGLDIKKEFITVIDRGCPHLPSGLPTGKMGIYSFCFNGIYLKIGKVGGKSDARFRSQHYLPSSSQSNLAKSLLTDPEMKRYDLNEINIGEWIRENTRRIDILVDSSLGIFVLNFLEAFLHSKFTPKYEGFNNQR